MKLKESLIEGRGSFALFISAALLVAYSQYLIFLVVPNERVMGPIQRIFYFHVASAMACYVSFAIVLIAGLAYLATRDALYDSLSEAAGEVGFLFCTIVLVSGMLWAKSAWNTYFNPEPRLLSFLLLWLIFLGFVLLRSFGDPHKIAVHSAVLGILGAVTVPLVIFSVKLLSTGQLHPQVVENRGLKDSRMIVAMFVSMGALILLQFALVWFRFRISYAERRILSRSH